MFSPTGDLPDSPPPVGSDATGGWTHLIARIAFRALIRQHLDDEQAAYDALVGAGCPVVLADRVWTAHCDRVRNADDIEKPASPGDAAEGCDEVMP